MLIPVPPPSPLWCVAMSHLNGQKVFGKVMRVTLSKHQTVALPREGLDDQLLTKGNGCIFIFFN